MITIEASEHNGFFKVDGVDYHKNHYTIEFDNVKASEAERNFSLCNIYNGNKIVSSRGYAEITGVTSWAELISLLNELGVLRNNDVMIADQTTAPVIGFFNKLVTNTTSTAAVAIGDRQMTLLSITGFVVGQYVQIFSATEDRFYLGNITAINGNIITVDTPFDFAFDSGAFVLGSIKNLNVDGSVTPQIFVLRHGALSLGVLDVDFDMTRIIFTCQTASAVDLSKFGDIAGGLTNGIVLRRTDGVTRNIFNAKTNGELANLMFDFIVQTASNPAQGQDGFIGRMTFTGQEKMGVALRIKSGEDLELIVQDNLSTLTSFFAIVEGHEVIY